jgi:hypothetical protein
MDFFYQLLHLYPQFNKVGFSLKTDDVTGSKEAKDLLKKWESLFYKHRLNNVEPYLYSSSIDTTFALYRPQKEWKNKNFYKGIRIDYPYQARHLPWYKDLTELNEEDKFYNQMDCGSGNWNSLLGLQKMKDRLMCRVVDHWWEHIFSIKKSSLCTIVRILGVRFTSNRDVHDIKIKRK